MSNIVIKDNSKQCAEDIQAAIYHIQHTEVFMCGLIQELNMRLDPQGPPAYIGYDKKHMKFVMGFNPNVFVKWNKLEQADILKHEVGHFLNKHLIRFKEEAETVSTTDMKIKNIAADMAINQFLPNIPYGCKECKHTPIEYVCKNKDCSGKTVNIKDWKDKDGKDLSPYKPYEYYFEQIKDSLKEENKKDKGDGKGKQGPNDGIMDKFKPTDEHDWESLTEEEKERMMQEAKNLIKRTLEKTSYDHTMIPGSVKDLLEELDSQLEKMDYKGILRRAIKKTVTVADREANWKRPNKRYGAVAPGTTVGKTPNIVVFQDTSGSMSTVEINEGNTIMDGFLKVGDKKCSLGLFHTSLYSIKKRRLGESVNASDIQSGGTDLTEVMEFINKNKPNLALILTDGCYCDVSLKEIKGCEVIFIIRDNNNLDHPLKRFGKTISYSALK